MTDEERNGPEETFHDTERKLRARIEQLEQENKRLELEMKGWAQNAWAARGFQVEAELALTQSRAETAAAYDRAAMEVTGYDRELERATIRALATTDQTAALDAVRAEAMREAAAIARNIKGGDGYIEMLVSDTILAAIKGTKA
jgi:uncharacterized protein (UPF0335 family)